MSSYFTKVNGNLVPNKTARVGDINQIQNNIQVAEQSYTTDMFGANFILGEDENSFKVTATTDYIDQSNNNYDEERCWISFYDRYLRQTIETTKSSIESITIHAQNKTNISTTIYAEIRDINYDIKQEANAVLNPTDTLDEKYTKVTFNFNKNNLPVGIYYFVLRPVDISATDLAKNGDEPFLAKNGNEPLYEINPSNSFKVRYDINGEYHDNLYDYKTDDNLLRGLEGSYNGSNYFDAYLLPDQDLKESDFNELDKNDPNYDLFFEEAYSSGQTFLIEPGQAIVLGQKVVPYATHVKINNASSLGDRTDLILLKSNGEYEVIEGASYTDEKKYPQSYNGLRIAYITTFKNGVKPSIIEQDDESDLLVRPRSMLERMRRVEKKTNYQMAYNAPSRIKYNCEVDPVMFNNGLTTQEANTERSYRDTEGSYRMGVTINSEGKQVISNNESVNLTWSIVKNNYKYATEETEKKTAYCQVFHVSTGPKTKTAPTHAVQGLYVAYISEKESVKNHTSDTKTLNYPVKKETIQVSIQKGTSIKHKKTLTTNSKGRATWNLNALNLKKGTYTIKSVVGGTTIKTTLKVNDTADNPLNKSPVTKSITLKSTKKVTVKESFNNNTITGDDDFNTTNLTVDTDNGVIELGVIDKNKGTTTYNKTISSTGSPSFSYKMHEYTIKSNRQEKSEFPVLHLKFDKDTYIEDICPHVSTFKDMKNFGVLLFKNDQILNMKDGKRKSIQKNFNKDIVFPTVWKSSKKISLSKANTSSNGKQVIKKYVTFKVNEELKAGTYTLMIYGDVKKGKEEGKIYLRQYDVHGNIDKYGMAGKCTGSSSPSILTMTKGDLQNTYWNVKIGQKKYKYYEEGTLISNPKNVSDDINKCGINSNIEIPPNSGCSVELYVSNDGGAQWVNATNTKSVTFTNKNNIFRWKMVFRGNGSDTPKLSFSKKKNYAIQFVLNTQSFYVPYEDFGRCYETPLLNAYNITKTFVANNQALNGFSEWEWARIFMLDEEKESNIDLCFSYADDNNTSVSTLKSNWNRKIFFSQIFADLKLADFSSESIDYDNYDGNVEYDEHNFLFKINSDYVMHNTGGIALATPIYVGDSYKYGNIAGNEDAAIINNLFNYTLKTDRYEYYGNADNTDQQYDGEHINKGPYVAAIYDVDDSPELYEDIEDSNKYKYVVNGISFIDGLDIDETKSILTVQLYPISNSNYKTDKEIQELEQKMNEAEDALSQAQEKVSQYTEEEMAESSSNTEAKQAKIDLNNAQSLYNTAKDNYEAAQTPSNVRTGKFPANSFTINIALTLDGTLSEATYEDEDGNILVDNSMGISYVVGQELEPNKITPINIDISEHIDAFKANGIRSIGVVINKAAGLKKNEGIGIGTVSALSYNRRPYVPYTYSGEWDRFKWKPLIDDAQIYNLCYDSNGNTFFYPSHKDLENKENVTISSPSDIASEYFKRYGTSIDYTNRTNNAVTKIERKRNNVTVTTGNTANSNSTFTSSTTGNAVVLRFPGNKTGKIFEIDTNIPFSIYDLVNIEYYMYNHFVTTSEPDTTNLKDNHIVWDGRKYTYEGAISKGDIKINFYTDTDITNKLPVETFTLPSWGRVQQNAHVKDKTVHAWFKTRSNASTIKKIVIERDTHAGDTAGEITLVLNNIFLYNTDTMPAFGPQMQMRIYPEDDLSEIQIRKVGCVYRI